MATNWCEIQPKYPLDINQDDISLLQFLGQEFLWNHKQKNFFLVDRSLFTFRWTDWKFRTLLVWSNLSGLWSHPTTFSHWDHLRAATPHSGNNFLQRFITSPRHKTFNQQETDLRAVSVFTGLTTQLNAHAGTLTESAVCRWGNLDTFCHRVARLQTLVPSDNLVFS